MKGDPKLSWTIFGVICLKGPFILDYQLYNSNPGCQEDAINDQRDNLGHVNIFIFDQSSKPIS